MGKGGWREFESDQSRSPMQGSVPPAPPRSQRRVRVQRTRAGKGGKMVTAITGLEMGEADARQLLRQLKARAGTGGTLRDGVIELQGDQVVMAIEALRQEGFDPKQAGG